MSIESTFYCDGPENHDIPGAPAQPDGCPHNVKAILLDPDYLPGGMIRVRRHVQGSVNEELHFCSCEFVTGSSSARAVDGSAASTASVTEASMPERVTILHSALKSDGADGAYRGKEAPRRANDRGRDTEGVTSMPDKANPFLLTTASDEEGRSFASLDDALAAFDQLDWKEQQTAWLVDTATNAVWLHDGEGAARP